MLILDYEIFPIIAEFLGGLDSFLIEDWGLIISNFHDAFDFFILMRKSRQPTVPPHARQQTQFLRPDKLLWRLKICAARHNWSNFYERSLIYSARVPHFAVISRYQRNTCASKASIARLHDTVLFAFTSLSCAGHSKWASFTHYWKRLGERFHSPCRIRRSQEEISKRLLDDMTIAKMHATFSLICRHLLSFTRAGWWSGNTLIIARYSSLKAAVSFPHFSSARMPVFTATIL